MYALKKEELFHSKNQYQIEMEKIEIKYCMSIWTCLIDFIYHFWLKNQSNTRDIQIVFLLNELSQYKNLEIGFRFIKKRTVNNETAICLIVIESSNERWLRIIWIFLIYSTKEKRFLSTKIIGDARNPKHRLVPYRVSETK